MPTPLPLISVSGSPYDQGFGHGSQIKDLVQRAIWLWRERVARVYGVHADIFIRRFLDTTDYRTAILEYTPDLMEEVEGLAKGADVDFDTMFAFQLMDEVWMNGQRALSGPAAATAEPEPVADKCTSLGVNRTKTHATIVAQNMDLEGFRNGYQVVIRHQPKNDETQQLVLTCAGLIATTGLNSAGLGVCVNALTQLRYEMQGLPVAFVIRGLLDQPGLQAACRFAIEVPHATGQNYLIGDRKQVRMFECSAGGATEYPGEGDGTLVHTNHPLASSDLTPQHLAYLDEHPDAPPGGANSATRLQTASAMLAQRKGSVDCAWVGSILSSSHPENPICAPYVAVADHHTFGSVVMALGEDIELLASAGPPDVNGYHTFRFEP
jgi:isopenicillin-N N-acyltransferase like protein